MRMRHFGFERLALDVIRLALNVIRLALDADAVGDGSVAGLEMRRTLDADAAMLALDVEGFWIGFGTGRFGWGMRSGTAQRLVLDAASSWVRWMRMRRCGFVE